MSESEEEIFEANNPAPTPPSSDSESENEYLPPPKPKKEKKEKKPRGGVMDEARRERLLANLKKGRETARINRLKRSEVKRIKQREKKSEIDDIILKDRDKRKSLDTYKEEIENLKLQIKNLTTTHKPKSEKLPEIKEEDFTPEIKQEPKKMKEKIQPIKKPEIKKPPVYSLIKKSKFS